MRGELLYRALLRLLPPRLRRDRGAEMEGAAAMETLLQDLVYALRSFRRRPGFALTAVLTLALGVGATTTIWSVVDGVLLSPLPYPAPDRLVQLGTLFRDDDGGRLRALSPPDVFDVQETSTTLEASAASRLERRVLGGDGEPEELSTAGVSAEYFEVLRVAPALGRAFTPEEDAAEGPPVAVLSHGFWRRRLGGDPGAVGRTLVLDGALFTVVGVMGPDFHPPGAIHHQDVELWYPLARVNDALDDRGSFFVQGIARLAPGSSMEGARAELAALGDRLSQAYPDGPRRRLGLAPLRESTVGDVGRTLWVLFGGVGLLLLIACANVANLFLVRATERDREMAVRAALGAGRWRTLRQLLTEGLVLAGAGGVVAVGLAHLGVGAFRRWSPSGIPRLDEVGVDPEVLAFALILSVATGLVFSAAPAARALGSATDPLREHASGASRGRARARSLLVIAQTAVALVLFVGAGLLVNSFVRLQRVDPGFDVGGVAWLRVYLRGDAYTSETRAAFYRDLLERARAIPGVEVVGGTDNLPLTRNRSRSFVSPTGLVLGPDESPPAVSWHAVLPGTFEALRMPVLGGRAFTERDDDQGPPVAMVNQAAANLLWPGEDPVGQTYVPGTPDSGNDPITVVGIVADVRHQRLDTPPEPEMYLSAFQFPRVLMNLLARTDGDPGALLEPLRQAVWEMDAGLPLPDHGTLSSHAADSIIEPRFYTLLLSTFAAVALALALVGVYGTLAYTVELRAHELGVRLALGARGEDLLGLVLRRGMTLVGVGLVLGCVLSLLAAGTLERFVFGITARDPATLAAVSAALAALSVVACLIPALRAARLDPLTTLRSE